MHKTFAISWKKNKKSSSIGGSGAFAIDNAKHCKADAYVTSDLKYHDFFKAENNILLADIGHYESEQFTKNLLVGYLTKKFLILQSLYRRVTPIPSSIINYGNKERGNSRR